jgi:hypothetical protein
MTGIKQQWQHEVRAESALLLLSRTLSSAFCTTTISITNLKHE